MNNEDKLKLLEQHWLHCRHLESERAWFMNVFAILTGGMLAFMAQADFKFKDEALWPLCFLELIAIFGLLHTTRWISAFEHHRQRVNRIIREIDHIMDVCNPLKGQSGNWFIQLIWKITSTKPIDKIGLMTMDIPSTFIVRTRILFPFFYMVVLALLLFILDYNFSSTDKEVVQAAIGLGAFFILYSLVCYFAEISKVKDMY